MRRGDRARRIAVELRADRCIHSKSSWALCSDCARACPSSAIHDDGPQNMPAFDARRCFGCGTCLTSCENDAFTSTGFDEEKVTAAIAAYPRVRLRCFLPYGELKSISSSLPSYQLSTCLSALTPGMLFQAAFDHVVVLATGHCASCAFNRTAGRQIERNVRTATLLLAEWGRQGHLRTAAAPKDVRERSDGGDAPSSQQQRPEQDSMPLRPLARPDGEPTREPSARSGQTAVQSKIHRLFNPSLAPAKASDARAEMPLELVSQRTSHWRDGLEALWKRAEAAYGEPSGEAYPWPQQIIDPELCRACGICRQLCPTGAIRHRFEDATFTYSFKPGSCIDCNLCARSCAQHAVTHAHAADRFPFRERTCFSAPAAACPRCGSPMLEGRDIRGLCLNCAAELGYDKLSEA